MTTIPTNEQITAHLAAGGQWLWFPTDGGDLVLWLIGEDAHEDMGVAFWDGDGWHAHASIGQIRGGTDGIVNGRPGHWGRIDWMGEDDHGPGAANGPGHSPGTIAPGGPMPMSCTPAYKSSRVRSSRQRRRFVCRFAQADRLGLKAIRETAPQ